MSVCLDGSDPALRVALIWTKTYGKQGTSNRMFNWKPARAGVKKTLELTLLMARIIIPVTITVVALEKLELLVPLAGFFSPTLQFLGLPGEAALVLLLGYLVNIYAALGALGALTLSPRELTVIAVMILTSHSLLMESPVLSYTGLAPWKSIPLRIGLGVALGMAVNGLFVLWGG